MAFGEKNLFLSFLLEPFLFELIKLRFVKPEAYELALETLDPLDTFEFYLAILEADALD